MVRLSNIFTFELFDSKGREVSFAQMYKAAGFGLSLNDEFFGYYDFPKKIGKVDKEKFINKIQKQIIDKRYYERQKAITEGLKRDFKKLEKQIELEEKLKLKKTEEIFNTKSTIIHVNFHSRKEESTLNGLSIQTVFTPTIDLKLNLLNIEKEIYSSITKLETRYKKVYDDKFFSNFFQIKMIVPNMEDDGSDYSSVVATPRQDIFTSKKELTNRAMNVLKKLLARKTTKENYKNIYKNSRIGFLGFEVEITWPVKNT